jgi:hypothetical protein
MKNILLLLLALTSFNFAFSQSNFDYKNKTIFWKKEFALNKPIEEIFSNSFKIELKSPKSGILKNTLCDCKGGSFYMKKEIFAEFRIDYNDNNYTITVFNIKFNEDVGVFMGGVSYKPDNTPAEYLFIHKDKQEIRDAKQIQLNLKCIDSCFSEIFNPTEF